CNLERGIEERAKLLRTRRMAQLAESLRLDLADPLARDIERAAHFLERMLGAIAHAEAHLEHLLFARRERPEDLGRLILQVGDDHVIDRRDHAAILDEIPKMRIFLFSDRSLEGDRLLRDLHDLANLGDRHVHPLRDLLRLRFAAELLHERTRRTRQLVDRLDHVHRDTNGAGLIGDRAGDGLANPPGGVGGELVAASILELLDRLHETDVAFLNQVEELQSAVSVLLGDRDDEAEVGDDQLLLGLIGFFFAGADLADRLLQLIVRGAVERLELDELFLVLLEAAAIEVAARLVLLALERLIVLADHRRDLRELAVDVLQLVDHSIARGRCEVDEMDLVGEIRLQLLHGLQPRGERLLRELLRLGDLRLRVLDLLVELGDLLEDHHDLVDLVDGGRRELRLAILVDLRCGAIVIRHRQIDHLLDDARVLLRTLVDLEDLFENDAVRGKRLVDAPLALLDSLGDIDFALAIEQLDRAHLAQIHADGIVGLVDDAGRCGDDVLLDFLALIHFLLFDRA